MTACGAPGVEATSIAAEGGDPRRERVEAGLAAGLAGRRLGLRLEPSTLEDLLAARRRGGQSTRDRKRRVRSSFGAASTSLGRPSSTMAPSSMKMRRSPTSRAKPISWVTTIIVMPALGELAHHVEHVLDQLRVEGARDLVEEHRLGLHRQGPRDRDPLLLAAREARRVLGRLVGQADAARAGRGRARGPPPVATPRTLTGAIGQVVEHRAVREQVERLEDHPQPAAQAVDRRARRRDLVVAQEDPPRGGPLQQVEAAQQRRLARPGGADDAHHLALGDVQVDALQHGRGRRSA